MNLPNATHPLWSWSRDIIVFGILAAVMFANSTRFDSTEIKALAEFAVLFIGLTGAHRTFKSRKRKEEASCDD